MKSMTSPLVLVPVEVRQTLVDALRLDLIGPGEVLGSHNQTNGSLDEVLPQRPSTWYLTGFLVPLDADETQKCDEQSTEEVDEIGDSRGADDATTPESTAARVKHLPSSMGISVLVGVNTKKLAVKVRWGEYKLVSESTTEESGISERAWRRIQRDEDVVVEVPASTDQPINTTVPNSGGLQIAISVRPFATDGLEDCIPTGTKSTSMFLINNRRPSPDEKRDESFAFQTQLEVKANEGFVPRPDLHCLETSEWDDRVADLQYRDVFEFAVGHGVSTEAVVIESTCGLVRTCWVPGAEVERVAPTSIDGVVLRMEELASLASETEVQEKLGAFETEYSKWIDEQRESISLQWSQKRKNTAKELLDRASVAAKRIKRGIDLLAKDKTCLEAFSITNRVMAISARRRFGVISGKGPGDVKAPEWRPFQLAFVLMNLPGISSSGDADREVVDLLFFPTGGGKTEAYLGLAAFTLVLRRLKNPGIASAGLSVLMRYTLRLLTLDQLSRAATLICALERERQQDVDKLGKWPFEIGLWVGKAATPNAMGEIGESNDESCRARLRHFKKDDRNPSPIPLEDCPWCGTKFESSSFNLYPNSDYPKELRVTCANRKCDFVRDPLPLLAVDEPIYRRLPCFMVATVDKFAALPWTGEVGQFFGNVHRFDNDGFYGPCEPGIGRALPNEKLLPPDLIIQDELHLISGPLGTIVGLYETALDELCSRDVDGKVVRAKIVASTATVRRADNQIRALFNRRLVDIFPPPGPDRRNSFFARTHTTQERHARLYLGIAAQGRSPKVVMLRVYLALLAAGQKIYSGQKKNDTENPTDAYMTLLGYFNSLRELGGARRLIEDEVGTRLGGYGSRKRVGEIQGLFKDRKIAYDVIELTSRISTDKVAEAKRRLQLSFEEKERVDVAIATNMISVGLDITRLGLMVVFGQPKTSSEYIQATSRVGRNDDKPGLVVTILNIHKPRDRSHYERFGAYHQTFYRSVEATSVTPFSPRALDRALAATLVGLSRQRYAPMTPPLGAHRILTDRNQLSFVVDAIAKRAESHADLSPADANALRLRVKARCDDLLDEWEKIAVELNKVGGTLQYQTEAGAAARLLYEFLSPDLQNVSPRFRKFRANRSMRDVEPSVNLWMKNMDGMDMDEEEAE